VARIPNTDDFAGVIIAYGASDDPIRDAFLHSHGKAAGALVNVADVKPLCDFITPSVVERDAVTIAISTGGTAPVIGRILRARIEAMLPTGYGQLARFLSGFRAKIEAKVTNPRTRRRFWEAMIDGPISDRFLEGDTAGAEDLIDEGLAQNGDEPGSVTIIGIGAGEADLVTFRALGAMQRADLVLHAQGKSDIDAAHDALRQAGIATQIIPGITPVEGENVVRLPLGETAPNHALSLSPNRV
jgi:uroporphyrin-III C-methyltransferase/precorrin-2 dehydrogenase/sirohydrochlorin ferrochelatase